MYPSLKLLRWPGHPEAGVPPRDAVLRSSAYTLPLGRWRRYILVFLATTLCCTVTLKLGEIQYLEWIFAIDLTGLGVVFLWDRMRVSVFKPYLSIATSYGIFLVLVFILGLFSLQQDFAPGTFFKAPVVVTLARMFELLLDAFYMIYLAHLFRWDAKLCRFGMMTYYWTGLAGCIYSLLGYPSDILFHIPLGTYLGHFRSRGFNNEGGGFGVYLVSVLVLAFLMHSRRILTTRQLIGGLLLITGGLIGSLSKSAMGAIAMLGIIYLVWFLRGWKRMAMLVALAASLLTTVKVLNLEGQFAQYSKGEAQYRALSNIRWGDGNYVMGRVAGAVLAPRMIKARPILGIGWGNYPLVRDDQEYRQGTAFALGLTDAPTLGILDYIVELGIPLWMYLTWIELKPVVMLKRVGADRWLITTALLLPVSTWSGAHLNLIHPWIVVAFALALAYPVDPRQAATFPHS